MNNKQTESSSRSRRKSSFEIPPPAIPKKDIKEVISTDIVVIGAGPAGLAAAVSAAEKGAKVILLEKYSRIASPGYFTGAVGGRLQKEKGIDLDKEEMISKLVEFSEGRADTRLVRKWIYKNGEVADWLEDMARAAGHTVNLFGNTTIIYGEDRGDKKGQKTTPTLLGVLAEEAKRRGVDIRYSTPAVRLLRPGLKGRVTGVIVCNADGSYFQINTARAVILCTGDYRNDIEMMEKYCYWAAHSPIDYCWPIMNTGDGHKMACWIGAAIEEEPHCVIVHFISTNESPADMNRPVIGKRGASLYVNKSGERFQNEDQPMELQAGLVMRQPGRTQWQVFDSKSIDRNNQDHINACIKTGAVLKADSLEALAARFGAKPAVFRATVERYNELVRMGKDLDFNKRSDLMTTPVDTPPFYVCESPPDVLAIMGGLVRNTDGQVVDKNWEVIPGLYTAGNIAGGFVGDTYPFPLIMGVARGCAFTFGRLAGIHAAQL
jgi:fumarate reductase flavoprotein subunit